MKISEKLILKLWPRNTLGVASLLFRLQEDRRAAARQGLERQYLLTRYLAEKVLTDPHQGILRTARSRLDRPPVPRLAPAQGRLEKFFNQRGRGFCRPAPLPLQAELRDYAALVGEICRSYGELEARLKTAQEILKVFAGNPEFCRAHFFRLALISPESAWLCFHLRSQRLRERQTRQHLLPHAGPPPEGAEPPAPEEMPS